MSATADLDKRQVRRGFERVAATYEEAAFLAREVGNRMRERLDFLRAVPADILDLGSGMGEGARWLRQRYPGCTVVELDFAYPMLAGARASASWWRRGVQRWKGVAPRICADVEKLPFRDCSFDMVWSNLTLHWVDLRQGLAEAYRVLRPGGVCMFSTLGPDTLKELRASYQQADGFQHVNRFVDMHDIGDMLVESRFADPVMDMEYLQLTYADVGALLRELRAAGARNANAARPPGLSGRQAFGRMRAAYERYREGGRLPVTFEVVYGHAWRPERERTTKSGEAIVNFHPLRGRNGG